MLLHRSNIYEQKRLFLGRKNIQSVKMASNILILAIRAAQMTMSLVVLGLSAYGMLENLENGSSEKEVES